MKPQEPYSIDEEQDNFDDPLTVEGAFSIAVTVLGRFMPSEAIRLRAEFMRVKHHSSKLFLFGECMGILYKCGVKQEDIDELENKDLRNLPDE